MISLFRHCYTLAEIQFPDRIANYADVHLYELRGGLIFGCFKRGTISN